MTNQVQPVLNNLPLKSQKHSLSAFVETSEQNDIIQSIENSIQVGKNDKLLLEVLSMWKMYLGINKSPDAAIELALVRDFILDNYKHITIGEIELAYKLAAMQKLEDCEYYGQFSPLYVGRVLNSYLYYRKIQLADPIRRQDKAKLIEQEKKNKPTPEDQANLTREIFFDFYNQFKNGQEITDVFNLCWNFLREQVLSGNRDFLHKWTNPQKSEYQEAMTYAENIIKNKEDKFSDLYEAVSGLNKESDVKKIARNYCVQKYFESLDNVEEIIKKIKPELFK